MDQACSRHGYKSAYRILLGKPEGNRALGGPGPKWEDDIKLDFGEMGCGGGMDWINLD
jgi:hypothetical protein